MSANTPVCYLIGDNEYGLKKCKQILQAHDYTWKETSFKAIKEKITKNSCGIIILCYKEENESAERMALIREITNVPYIFIVGSIIKTELIAKKGEYLFSIFDPLSSFMGDLVGKIGSYIKRAERLEGALRPL